ncbi:MAG: outer membrane protein assembly factor BamA, partial [Campylobacterota bacterium]|nr:outer membrane protein assembly factor BamA [Campylobacterota bacterium]
EKPIISKIEMKGYKENDEETQAALLQIKKGAIYDEKRLESVKKRIIDALSQEGKIDSVVEIETQHLENGSVKVVFRVNEGENIIIEQLDFDGPEGLDPELFDEVLANKEHQWMGWFWGRNDGKMQLSQMQYDPLRIRDLYMQYGYLDAKIDEPFVRVDFDHYSAQISYQLSEGEVYRVSDIILDQRVDVMEDEALREVIKLKMNEAFNIKTFREDSERIKTAIADLGYAFVQVVPDLRKDAETKSVEVVYSIKPGEKVRIRNVIIAGNNRTLDRIVRRELYLGPGDMYNLTDLKDSRNALGRTGYFEGTTIEEKRIDTHTMDLIVKVKEAPTGNIQLGGGYGSYGGILLTVGVSDRNIFGSGINMGIELEKSELTQNYSFNISNSRLNDSDFSGNFSVYHSSYQYNDYTVNSQGISLGTGHRFTRHITGYLGYGYADTGYQDYASTVFDSYYAVFFESYAKSSITLSATFDNTDDFYLPREGFVARQSFERSGIGGDADYFKSRTNFSAYKGLEPFIGVDFIVRYKARYNHATDKGYLPLAERYYMGGMRSVRGYESYSLAPSYVDENGQHRRVGGTETFSNNFEISAPLLPKAKMRLAAFYDWGWITGETPEHVAYNNIPTEGDIQDIIRSSYGVALEWFSPMGPIQLVYAN